MEDEHQQQQQLLSPLTATTASTTRTRPSLDEMLMTCQSNLRTSARQIQERVYLANSQRQENHPTEDNSNQIIPDPVQLIQRLQALEVTMQTLQKDVAAQEEHRREAVTRLLEMQQQTVHHVQSLLNDTEEGTKSKNPYDEDGEEAEQQQQQEETWQHLTGQLDQQCQILQEQQGSSTTSAVPVP